jgi:hypothetical protein
MVSQYTFIITFQSPTHVDAKSFHIFRELWKLRGSLRVMSSNSVKAIVVRVPMVDNGGGAHCRDWLDRLGEGISDGMKDSRMTRRSMRRKKKSLQVLSACSPIATVAPAVCLARSRAWRHPARDLRRQYLVRLAAADALCLASGTLFFAAASLSSEPCWLLFLVRAALWYGRCLSGRLCLGCGQRS